MNSSCISYIGEFNDKRLEKEYISYDIGNAIRYVQPIVLGLAILYLLFIIPDYFLIKNASTFRTILLNRIIVFVLITLLYFRLKYLKNYESFFYWVTGYEFVCVFSFLLILYQYETPNFLIQSFGVMTILLAVFLIPNRWIFMVFVSVFISGGFFILSLHILKSIRASELSASLVYISITIILCSISAWKTNYYKRMQYINSKKLKDLSIIDPLTQIYNRLKFEEELQKHVNYAKRYDSDLSLILFDFDDFKKVNDDFGHLAGDRALVNVATLVKKSIRENDVFARWGGEEFIIILPNTSKETAVDVAGRIKNEIQNLPIDKIGGVTCSFGVTSLYNNDDDINSLINRVDNLLYMAKNTGKNKIIGDFEL